VIKRGYKELLQGPPTPSPPADGVDYAIRDSGPLDLDVHGEPTVDTLQNLIQCGNALTITRIQSAQLIVREIAERAHTVRGSIHAIIVDHDQAPIGLLNIQFDGMRTELYRGRERSECILRRMPPCSTMTYALHQSSMSHSELSVHNGPGRDRVSRLHPV